VVDNKLESSLKDRIKEEWSDKFKADKRKGSLSRRLRNVKVQFLLAIKVKGG